MMMRRKRGEDGLGWDPAVIESELPRTSGAGLAPPHRPERQKDAV